MLICNARKRCPKKNECAHAIKHFSLEDCENSIGKECPEEIKMVKRKIWCKPCGASISRVARKSRAKLHKVKQPITQYEAQQALYQLKNMAIVEFRMSGGKISTTFDNHLSMMGLIQGASVLHLKNVIPDYRERGLDRYQVINYLSKEVTRQNELRVKRTNQKRCRDCLVKSNEEREMSVHWNASRRTEKVLSNNYELKRSRYGSLIYTEHLKEGEVPTFHVRKSRNGGCYTLSIPNKMIVKEVKKHLVVCNYDDKKAESFPCFALIGARLGFGLVATMVENGVFTDPMFKSGESKMEIKKRR